MHFLFVLPQRPFIMTWLKSGGETIRGDNNKMNTHTNSIFSRRNFLKAAGLAAGAAALSSCASAAPTAVAKPTDTALNRAAVAAATSTPSADNAAAATSAPVNVKPFTTYDATMPAISADTTKKLTIESSDQVLYIASGVAFQAWTYGGTVPGPVVALNEGDEVQFELKNGSNMAHSIDFHAAQTPPSKNYISIQPKESLKYNWKANHPGCFMYHCGTPFVLHHMAMGMYGATIVRPKSGLEKADREFVLVQSEFYVTAPTNGVVQTDLTKALSGIPDYVSFNGYANQYKDKPLTAKVGELIRMWIMNAGPTHYSAFHVIGTIFDAAYQSGNPANKMVGVQTVNVYPGSGMMVEFRIPEAGAYPFVTHSFADASKGALGVLTVTNS